MSETKSTPNFNDANAYLGQKPVGKLLLKFSIPCVLSMLVGALYNIVDQIFIGQGVGYLGNAATNVVYPFTVVALAISLLIGDGSAALLSLSLGRKDNETAHKSVGNAIIMTAVLSIVLTAVGFIFEDQILTLFGATEACFDYAKEYMTVILIGIPFYIFTTSLNGAIRADGSPKYSMIATVIGAIINIILDPIAIFALNMGVTGAAIATIIGQITTAIISILYFRKTKAFKLTKESFKPSGKIIGMVSKLGVSSFVIQIAIVVVMSISNNLIGKYGPQSIFGADIPLSVVGIVMKVFGIVMSFPIGISVGGQPIIGYNYGAKKYGRVIDTLKHITISNAVVGVIATLLFEFCPQFFINMFGSESELYNRYALMTFRVFLAGILLCCVQKGSCIFLQSIGKPAKSMTLSLTRDIIFFIPAMLIITPLTDVETMLWSAPIADVLSFIITVTVVALEVKNIKKLEAEQKMLNEQA